ncbi:hypothetical protein [Micromonospora sp. NBC_00858]|uniref:hypothetical protein n=1 Tax=Micromonospora sp. NBC_00858 TaxID=2975979 RepID=UPI003864D48F|nr:hypothetical protein OG990_04360 [Micromonospora sp. NBC_00858]
MFDGADPLLEALAVAAGHHDGEGSHVCDQPVEVAVAAANFAQLDHVAGVEVVGGES